MHNGESERKKLVIVRLVCVSSNDENNNFIFVVPFLKVGAMHFEHSQATLASTHRYNPHILQASKKQSSTLLHLTYEYDDYDLLVSEVNNK